MKRNQRIATNTTAEEKAALEAEAARQGLSASNLLRNLLLSAMILWGRPMLPDEGEIGRLP